MNATETPYTISTAYMARLGNDELATLASAVAEYGPSHEIAAALAGAIDAELMRRTETNPIEAEAITLPRNLAWNGLWEGVELCLTLQAVVDSRSLRRLLQQVGHACLCLMGK